MFEDVSQSSDKDTIQASVMFRAKERVSSVREFEEWPQKQNQHRSVSALSSVAGLGRVRNKKTFLVFLNKTTEQSKNKFLVCRMQGRFCLRFAPSTKPKTFLMPNALVFGVVFRPLPKTHQIRQKVVFGAFLMFRVVTYRHKTYFNLFTASNNQGN